MKIPWNNVDKKVKPFSAEVLKKITFELFCDLCLVPQIKTMVKGSQFNIRLTLLMSIPLYFFNSSFVEPNTALVLFPVNTVKK